VPEVKYSFALINLGNIKALPLAFILTNVHGSKVALSVKQNSMNIRPHAFYA
jgi:hypothetical protein